QSVVDRAGEYLCVWSLAVRRLPVSLNDDRLDDDVEFQRSNGDPAVGGLDPFEEAPREMGGCFLAAPAPFAEAVNLEGRIKLLDELVTGQVHFFVRRASRSPMRFAILS